MDDGISIREFARRSQVSHTLVVQAIQAGKLTKRADGKMDPAHVNTPWRAPARGGAADLDNVGKPGFQAAPSAPPVKGVAYSEALRLKENYLALLRRSEYEERSGSLVELSVAQGVLFDTFRLARDSWLNWPVRVAPMMAVDLGLRDLDLLVTVLTAYIHQQLSEFAEAPEVTFERRS